MYQFDICTLFLLLSNFLSICKYVDIHVDSLVHRPAKGWTIRKVMGGWGWWWWWWWGGGGGGDRCKANTVHVDPKKIPHKVNA